jgi:hypothetical protein
MKFSWKMLCAGLGVLSLMLFVTTQSHAGPFDKLQDAVNTPIIPKKNVPYVIDDAKLAALNPNYLGPEGATEASKLYVKHAKDMALSMSSENVAEYGWKQLETVCTSAGFAKNKLTNKYAGWPMDADGATAGACNMFVTNNVVKVLTLSPSVSGFRTQEDGRLIPHFMFGGLKSKGKEIICSDARLGARAAKRMATKEFGNNPEVIPASEALAMTWEATRNSWQCDGVGGYIGW